MSDLRTIFGANKLLKHHDRVAVWQRGVVPAPVTMEFDLTGRCNHRCPQCTGGYRCGDMHPDDARSWLSQLASAGTRGVTFTGGGEPLCHSTAVDLVEYAAGLGMSVGLITNGCLLTPGQADRLSELCEWVRVSIDAGTPDQYRATHGMGPEDFLRAWKAVAMLASARDRWGAPCTVGIGYLVSETTAGGIVAAHEMANNAGADYLQLRPFHWESIPLATELLEMTGRCRVICSEAKYRAMGRERSYTTCHGAWFTGVVQADGQLALCCHLRGCACWTFGNLHEIGFRDAWESREHRRLIEAVDLTQCVPLCRNDGLSEWLEATRRPMYHESFL